ncbi:hypothetical protein N7G274_005120 [Stereocaulon virgatum]|uniref:Yeast cell wall synthesis Kre9/Knh1-like N-terminal domain-containing protein n=1 Tax=Stereocaulon virgatum TaxID=373712 RepID=A0ABR4A7Q0_9LECA
MYTTTATLALLASIGLSAAQSCARLAGTPFTDGSLPVRAPGKNQVVAAGSPFTIKWDPTSNINTVSIQLLIGSSNNNGPLSCIAKDVPNTGSFVWTPAKDLVPYGDSNYGLQIISDKTDQNGHYYFQYSTQFGVSNSNVQSSVSSSASKTATGEHSGHTDSTSGTVTATSYNAHTTTHTTSSYVFYSLSSSEHSSHSKTLSRSSVLVVASSGFPTASKNSSRGVTPSGGTNILASTGGIKNSTAFIRPSTSVVRPTSLAPVTSVAIQTASTLPPTQAPSLTSSPVATSSPTGAAVSMVAGGMLAGLGGLAALVL